MRYEQIYSFLLSVLGYKRRKTQFLKDYVNHTMLTTHTTHLVVFKISAGGDPKNSTTAINGQLQLNCLFEILKFSGYPFME